MLIVAAPAPPSVAPHAGAWIETLGYDATDDFTFVAPHAGAWIETLPQAHLRDRPPSHPMRVRGLKLSFRTLRVFRVSSHPMRVRGLKHFVVPYNEETEHVAPHAGAWIETEEHWQREIVQQVAPHAGAWIETDIVVSSKGGTGVAPHAGALIAADQMYHPYHFEMYRPQQEQMSVCDRMKCTG